MPSKYFNNMDIDNIIEKTFIPPYIFTVPCLSLVVYVFSKILEDGR